MGRACGPWVGWAASPIDVKRLTRTPASYSTHTQGHHSSHTTSDRVESILCEIRDSDVVMLYVGRIASYVRMRYIAIGLHDPRCAGAAGARADSARGFPRRVAAGLAVPDAGRCRWCLYFSCSRPDRASRARVVHRNGLHLVTGETVPRYTHAPEGSAYPAYPSPTVRCQGHAHATWRMHHAASRCSRGNSSPHHKTAAHTDVDVCGEGR